jgi:hypothetical protein
VGLPSTTKLSKLESRAWFCYGPVGRWTRVIEVGTELMLVILCLPSASLLGILNLNRSIPAVAAQLTCVEALSLETTA